MEKDITRLTTITERFSKIGSLPDLKRTDIVSETKKNLEYLKKRNSKLISYHLDLPDIPVFVNLNSELYSWSLENLIKNSIDAMRGKGDVYISIKENAKEVSLTIRDTGRDNANRRQKAVCSDGYRTKNMGSG